MEFSISRSLQQFSDEYSNPFPNLSSQPMLDNVNPGLGQAVNLFETIVPLRGKALHTLEQKVASKPKEETSELSDQIGAGENKMSPNIFNSFMHPIKTDSIVLAPDKKNIQKSQKRKADESKRPPHKFQIV